MGKTSYIDVEAFSRRNRTIGGPVDTRTIAVAALVIAIIIALFVFVL